MADTLRKSKAKAGKISEETTDDFIYSDIHAAIMERQILPGTKLGEDSVAKLYGVSRTTIRRVLLRLAHERLVTLEPNRGAFVAIPSIQESKKVIAARKVIEAAIVREVSQCITESQIKELSQLIESERIACARKDVQNMIRLTAEFHLRLAKISSNEILVGFVKELLSQTSLILALYEVPGLPICSKNEHAEILETIATGDAEHAVELMMSHLDDIEKALDFSSLRNRAVKLSDVLGL